MSALQPCAAARCMCTCVHTLLPWRQHMIFALEHEMELKSEMRGHSMARASNLNVDTAVYHANGTRA